MNTILSLGLVLLIGLLAARLVNKIRLPSVTAFLILGILIGPAFFNLISEGLYKSSGLISNVVLGLIAFGIGQNFSLETFRKIGRPVIWISVLGAICPWLLVTVVLAVILRLPFYVSLIFGAIAAATAPAATVMVVREYRARGTFTDTLLSVVAIDDAWCLIIFAISLAIGKAIAAHTTGNFFMFKVLFKSLFEISGAFVLGGVITWILSKFSKYIRSPVELLTYTLGFVFLTIGLAVKLGLSVLLATMFLGAFLVNLNKTSFRFFDTLKTIDSPVYLLFFVLAGAHLEIELLAKLGLMGILYILFRTLGKVIGAGLGAYIADATQSIKKYLGLAMTPQAGVALGCALIAKADFPEFGGIIFTTIVATTVIFELIGPILTKFALGKAGEIGTIQKPE